MSIELSEEMVSFLIELEANINYLHLFNLRKSCNLEIKDWEESELRKCLYNLKSLLKARDLLKVLEENEN